MWLTRLALKRPIFILMMSLMVVVLGYVSLSRLSVDLFPEINMPLIRVSTNYPGAGPIDIEKSITEPIERAVAATPGVNRVESASRQGASVISVWFNFGTNMDNAQVEVLQRVSRVANRLPPGIQQPFVSRFDLANFPVVSLVVSSDTLDETQLYDLAYNVIQPQIERLDGVASADVRGGKIRQVQVKVRRDALRARGLDILDVVSAVRSSNLILPSGTLRTGTLEYNVFSNTEFETVRSIDDVILRPPVTGTVHAGSAATRLADVAEVEDGTADQTEIVRINGQRGVYLRVLKQPSANTIEVVDAVRAALPALRGVPGNVNVSVTFDQSTYIRAAVSALQHEALWGSLFAVVVILFFLVSLRATGIIAVAIPLSIMATFVLLYFTGQTLNVFTMGGLALAVGRLVDDSLVELENIHRHLERGQDRRTAVLSAAQEVAMPILVSTITTIVVFFPVLFLTGVAKNLFLPLALTVSFALLISFFVSRTVTPLLCLRVLKAGSHDEETRGVGGWCVRFLDWLDGRYARGLGFVLRHRGATILVILVVFTASLGLKSLIGTEFFPESDERQFTIRYRTPIATRVEKTAMVASRLEGVVRGTLPSVAAPGGGERPPFSALLSSCGLPQGRGGGGGGSGPHTGSVQVYLVPGIERPYTDLDAVAKVRKALGKQFSGIQIFFSTGGIVKRVLNMGSEAPIDVEVLGYDIAAGSAHAKLLFEQMRTLKDDDGAPLLTDVEINREENYPELDVVVDREKAGVLAITEQQVGQAVLTALVGNTQFQPIPYTDPKTGREYNINVRMADAYRSQISDLGDLPLRSRAGGLVSLSSIAKIERGSGPVVINRKYMQRIVNITANVAPGKDLGTAGEAVQRVLDDSTEPEGFTVKLGGQVETQKEAFSGLTFAAIMALLLVYMVLASQFESLINPLVIMFSVPLGISGVFAMLYLTDTTLNVNSFMGIIMMVGIVVSNAVLLVDFANVLRGRGKGIVEATIEAGRTRLRPILMTTVATLVGLAPMAIGIGEGAETNMPLARAVIGGLAVSTVFTLFLVPVLYTIAERFSRKQHLAPPEVEPEAANA